LRRNLEFGFSLSHVGMEIFLKKFSLHRTFVQCKSEERTLLIVRLFAVFETLQRFLIQVLGFFHFLFCFVNC